MTDKEILEHWREAQDCLPFGRAVEKQAERELRGCYEEQIEKLVDQREALYEAMEDKTCPFCGCRPSGTPLKYPMDQLLNLVRVISIPTDGNPVMDRTHRDCWREIHEIVKTSDPSFLGAAIKAVFDGARR